MVREHSKDKTDAEVQLHSFDNGLKLATKNDNWEQLYKFFRKKGMPIGKNDFDPVMHCVRAPALADCGTRATVRTLLGLQYPTALPAHF